jgi:hypothetical protein
MTGWDDVATVPGPGPAGHVELPENGWGALVGWAAGVERLVRCPDRLDRHATRITTTSGTGTGTYERTRTAAEQAEVDADINEYLAQAGAPPRPSGYRWFLHVPAGTTNLERILNNALDAAEPPPVHPRDIARHLRSALRALYG